MQKRDYLSSGCLTAIIGALCTAPALAQQGDPVEGEIIVTARKRDETSIAVPVTLTAVSDRELQRRGVIKFDDLARIVPQLQIGNGGTNNLGGIVAIRGISGSEGNPFGDGSVSFNVDGVQVSKVLIRRMAETDLAQVEVLKGPQALFFGKNSPAGIISLNSADPTSTFQAKASLGHEFNAREWRAEGFVSGPIGETVGVRVAGMATTMRGWFDNTVDGSNVFRMAARHAPKPEEYAVRGTLTWAPDDRFDARLKVGYTSLKDVGPLFVTERSVCPLGAPQLGGGPDDCKLNGRAPHLNVGPFLSTLSELFPDDGKSFTRTSQLLVSHRMNYSFSDALKLTSVTGYYDAKQRVADLFNPAWNPAQALPSGNTFRAREISQEVRLASDYDGATDFVVGGFYQGSKTVAGSVIYIGLQPNAAGVNPTQVND